MEGGFMKEKEYPTTLEGGGEIILTLDEAAERLKVSKWTVNRLIQERKLASIKIGARRLVPLSDITGFIERARDIEASHA